MPYEYTTKEELEQDIQKVKKMLVDVEQKMQLTNISWEDQMDIYLSRMHAVEKLSTLNNQLSNFRE